MSPGGPAAHWARCGGARGGGARPRTGLAAAAREAEERGRALDSLRRRASRRGSPGPAAREPEKCGRALDSLRRRASRRSAAAHWTRYGGARAGGAHRARRRTAPAAGCRRSAPTPGRGPPGAGVPCPALRLDWLPGSPALRLDQLAGALARPAIPAFQFRRSGPTPRGCGSGHSSAGRCGPSPAALRPAVLCGLPVLRSPGAPAPGAVTSRPSGHSRPALQPRAPVRQRVCPIHEPGRDLAVHPPTRDRARTRIRADAPPPSGRTALRPACAAARSPRPAPRPACRTRTAARAATPPGCP